MSYRGELVRIHLRRSIADSRLALALFFVLALLQGSYFISAIGPLTMPDTDMNANTPYAIATGQIFNLPHTETDKFGNHTKVQYISGDARLLKLTGRINTLVDTVVSSPLSPSSKQEKQRVIDHEPQSTITVPTSHIANRSNQYFPLVYLPQAAGIRIALWLNSSPYQVWQAGRIANFIVFLTLMGLAIVIIPRAKTMVACIAVFPMTVFIGSSLMADAFFINISACFLALFFRVSIRTTPATTLQVVCLGILSILLFYSKLVYVALAILLLALPHHVLSRKRKVITIGTCAVVALLSYGLWSSKYAGMLAITNIENNVHWMRHNPFTLVKTITWNIIFLPTKVSSDQILTMQATIILGVAWLYLLQTLPKHQAPAHEQLSSWVSRNRYIILSVVVFLICLYLTFTALCLTWNAMPTFDSTTEIQGFQGRYILPLLPLLVSVAFYPKRPSLRSAGASSSPDTETQETDRRSEPAHSHRYARKQKSGTFQFLHRKSHK